MIAPRFAWAGVLRCPTCGGAAAPWDDGFACSPCGETYSCPENVPGRIPAGVRERRATVSPVLFARSAGHGEGHLGSGTPERVRGSRP